MEEFTILKAAVRSNPGPKPQAVRRLAPMGALVLTNTRAMFLSSGSSGIVETMLRGRSLGVLAVLGEKGQVRRAAEKVDDSALQTEGSWQIMLRDLSACEAGGSWFTDHRIRIAGKDASGQAVEFCCFMGDIDKHSKAMISTQVMSAKASQVGPDSRS